MAFTQNLGSPVLLHPHSLLPFFPSLPVSFLPRRQSCSFSSVWTGLSALGRMRKRSYRDLQMTPKLQRERGMEFEDVIHPEVWMMWRFCVSALCASCVNYGWCLEEYLVLNSVNVSLISHHHHLSGRRRHRPTISSRPTSAGTCKREDGFVGHLLFRASQFAFFFQIIFKPTSHLEKEERNGPDYKPLVRISSH